MSTSGVVQLSDGISNYRTLIFIAYHPTANDYRTIVIPRIYFTKDSTSRYTVYNYSPADGATTARIILVSYNSDTSINIPYVSGNVVLKAVYGVK